MPRGGERWWESQAVVAAFLDTCVLFPMILRDTLLDAAQARLFSPYWSGEILAELHRNLIEDRGLRSDQATGLIAAMRDHFSESAVVGYEHLTPLVTNHRKDRHVVAAAAAAHVDVIVTSNLRDFPPVALAPFGLRAESPDSFLNRLFEDDSERLLRVLRRLASTYQAPAMPFDAFLARLATHAPSLVARLVDAAR